MDRKIAIVGAGISGLSCAWMLSELGLTPTIFSKDHIDATTSMKAAAIWFPFKAAPQDKVNAWSRWSLDYYERFVQDPGSGVSKVDFWVLDTPEQAGNWIDAIPADRVRLLQKSELPLGYDAGYLVKVPRIDTSVFLPYLVEQLASKGIHIRYEKIDNLKELTRSNTTVINCTGLEAGLLTGDAGLYPIRGQILKVKKQPGIRPMADDYGPNALSYIIPRTNDMVLGGTAHEGDYSLAADAEESSRIYDRCRGLDPDLSAEVLTPVVGLRPGRKEIRLELDPSGIIHNYGHGGSGYTVCWGCAMAVRELVNV